MNAMILDIETIPSQTLPDNCRPEFDESEVKLGNLKDRFKIEEKINAARAEWESKLDKQMSLDPDLCQICTVVIYDCHAGRVTASDFAEDEESERRLLISVWNTIKYSFNNNIPIVTFNGKSFDIPVLLRRAMYLDVSVNPVVVDAMLERYDKQAHIDLMQILAFRNPFSGKPEAKSLNYYLNRFQLGSKGGMTGADVYPLFKEGKHQEIVDYCKNDVMQTAELFKRVAPWLIKRSVLKEQKAA